MRQWFPFTDYDFYAYLTAGMLFLGALDFGLNSGRVFLRPEWTTVQIVLVVGLAYIVGQLLAGPSSIILEHWLARRVLHPPVTIQLGLAKKRGRERFVGRHLVGRYYEALPERVASKILAKVSSKLGITEDAIEDPEEVFLVAYPVARGDADAAARMDQFRNLYGFNQNISFVGAVGAVLFIGRAAVLCDFMAMWMGAAALLLSIGTFTRFLKFYAAFSAEVLRTFHSRA